MILRRRPKELNRKGQLFYSEVLLPLRVRAKLCQPLAHCRPISTSQSGNFPKSSLREDVEGNHAKKSVATYRIGPFWPGLASARFVSPIQQEFRKCTAE